MEADGGGLWPLLTILGPLVLAGAIIYGMVRWRRRSAGQKRAGDEKTKRLYREAE
jgi:hypothetical protein